MNREVIYSALWEKLQAIQGIVTFGRKLRHWSEMPAIEQPALFMACGNQHIERIYGGLDKYKLPATLYLYVNTADDPQAAPSIKLNELLDAIEAIVAPSGEIAQTLGGLVSHCWIAGTITTDEGVLGEQAMAIVPIDILAPTLTNILPLTGNSVYDDEVYE